MREFNEEVVAKNDVSPPYAAPPKEIAEQLLEPVLRFLNQAGITERQASAAFSSAWRKSVRRSGNKLALTSLEDPQPFVDLVGLWSRHPEYLDKNGLSRDLPMRGRAGFAKLVRQSGCNMPPKRAMSLLEAYGNIQLLANGKARLTKPFFHIRSNQALAFEPSVRFLLDAATNVRGSLDKTNPPRTSSADEQHFWRSVDSRQLPRSKRRQYLSFVKSLSLTFLQDVDDWLSEHAAKRRDPGGSTARVGLGLFTIESSSE